MDEPSAGREAVPRRLRPRDRLNIALGIVLTAIGVLGIITPVLPTTVFLLMASALFLKSSPRLHARLHRSKVTGPYLSAYTRGTGLSRGRKAIVVVVLWATLIVSAWFVRETLWVLILLAAVGVGVTLHVALIRPRQRPAQRVPADRSRA
ncbi:MAG: YbaN family protein [Spirochaetales bacterium]